MAWPTLPLIKVNTTHYAYFILHSLTVTDDHDVCVNEFTDERVNLFPYDSAKEVDRVYNTVYNEMEMANKPTHESHAWTHRINNTQLCNCNCLHHSAVHDTVNTATFETS